MSCRLAVAVNCYPLKWKSLERWRDLGVQGRPPRQTFKTYCCVTRLFKKNVTSRGKGRAHMSKSQVQQNTNEKESSWNEKKGTYETVFLLISSTHQIANIILDDGQFARESEKAGGRWRRGSCSLLYCGHWGKLQSSVFRLEYLTHCERHYFSLIPRVFLKEGTWDINFRSETGVKAVPFWGWWRWESRLRVALWKEKVRSVGWLCASEMRGDHKSKTQIWLCVWAWPYGTCTLCYSISRSFYLKAITLPNVQKSQNIKRQF